MSTTQAHRFNGQQHSDSPPSHDLEAEKAVLGSLLLSAASSENAGELLSGVRGVVASTDFYRVTNGFVFDAIISVSESGRPFDAVTVGDELAAMGRLEEVGGGSELLAIVESVPTVSHAAYYANIVKRHSVRRAARERLRVATERLSDPLLDVEDIIAEMDFGDLLQSSRGRFQTVTAAELAATEHSVRWVIPDILVASELTVWGAPQKAMKTSTLADLGISLATATRWLNYFHPSEPTSVAFFTGEQGLPNLKNLLSRVATSKGGRLEDIHNLHLSTELPQVSDAGQMRAFERRIVDAGWQVVILDPWYLMSGGLADAAGNLQALGNAWGAFVGMARRTGAAVIVAHHFNRKRAGANGPADLYDLSQAGAAEACAAWVLLNRRSPFDELCGRNELWLTIGGRSGQSGLYAVDITEGLNGDLDGRRWEVSINGATDAKRSERESRRAAADSEKEQRRAEQASADRKRIYRALGKSPNGETKSMIRDMAGVRTSRFEQSFSDILLSGDVVACEVTKDSGRTFPGFKLSTGYSDNSDNSDKTCDF